MSEQTATLQCSGERYSESLCYQAALYWVYQTITAITEDTPSVKIEIIVAEDESAQFNVTVAGADLGKVIGKGGSTSRAIRKLLWAIGGKDGKRYSIDFYAAGTFTATSTEENEHGS